MHDVIARIPPGPARPEPIFFWPMLLIVLLAVGVMFANLIIYWWQIYVIRPRWPQIWNSFIDRDIERCRRRAEKDIARLEGQKRTVK